MPLLASPVPVADSIEGLGGVRARFDFHAAKNGAAGGVLTATLTSDFHATVYG